MNDLSHASVPNGAEERRLDHWLAEWIPNSTRSEIKKWIDAGRVKINGTAASKAGLILKPGDEVTWSPIVLVDKTPKGVSMELNILYEDDALVVVNKPAGLIMHPGHGEEEATLVHGLLGTGMTLSNIGAPMRPGIVHRLDRDTSGVVLVAKTDETHLHLQQQFADRSIKKLYLALVWGRPKETEGELNGPIGRHRNQPTKMTVRRGGKPALTTYETMEWLPGFALIQAQPWTGRTHQIRVHLSQIHHPIVGDRTYGGGGTRGMQDPQKRKAISNFKRVALHAASIEFMHPTKQKRFKFKAPLPKEFESLLKVLRS